MEATSSDHDDASSDDESSPSASGATPAPQTPLPSREKAQEEENTCYFSVFSCHFYAVFSQKKRTWYDFM